MGPLGSIDPVLLLATLIANQVISFWNVELENLA